MMKLIGGGLAALALGLALAAPAQAESFNGSEGDRDARAFWLDTGKQVADPYNFPHGVCQVRAGGVSEAELMSPPWTGSISATFVRAAEYHFCPEYLE